MNDDGKSDKPIVPKKATNKGCSPEHLAEWVEGRGLAKGNPGQYDRHWTQYQMRLPNALSGYARLKRHHPRQEPGAVVPHAGICAGGGP